MKNISLQIDFDSFYNASEEELTITCDRELTGVLFYNLIENAIKYSSSHSIVEIVGIHAPGSLLIAVSDHGEGMEYESLEKIFERFYRLQKTATKAQGSGLGLAICKVVADSMGAEIWAKRTSTMVQLFILKSQLKYLSAFR